MTQILFKIASYWILIYCLGSGNVNTCDTSSFGA